MIKNILVTGAGALLGQGILRLLQVSDFPKKVYTADPDARSTGHWLGDHALLIPKVSAADYLEQIEHIVVAHKIDAILVGTDVELPLFAKHKEYFIEKYQCKVVVSSEPVVEIANDKFLTAKFLEENGFPFPFSVMASDKQGLIDIGEKIGFPLFAKPFNGARSIGIRKIENAEELLELYDPESDLVVQQFLSDKDGEFTSGCTVVNGTCKAIVTLKRDLRDGNTYRTYRDESTSIYDEYIKAIAERLNPDGPVNFQFRIDNGKPIVFEINGRFSGTTPLRYFYGYNEVEALLKFYLLGVEIHKPTLKNGVVLRAWSDIFVEEEQMAQLEQHKHLEKPVSQFYNFKL